MKTLNYKGHKVAIYETYYGDDVYITLNGQKVYSSRVTRGQAMERVKYILG